MPTYTFEPAGEGTGRLTIEVPIPTGADLIRTFTDRGRDGTHVQRCSFCPACGENVTTVGLPDVAFVFDSCDCGDPDYTHLVEQLWHRRCLEAKGA